MKHLLGRNDNVVVFKAANELFHGTVVSQNEKKLLVDFIMKQKRMLTEITEDEVVAIENNNAGFEIIYHDGIPAYVGNFSVKLPLDTVELV